MTKILITRANGAAVETEVPDDIPTGTILKTVHNIPTKSAEPADEFKTPTEWDPISPRQRSMILDVLAPQAGLHRSGGLRELTKHFCNGTSKVTELTNAEANNVIDILQLIRWGERTFQNAMETPLPELVAHWNAARAQYPETGNYKREAGTCSTVSLPSSQ